MLKWTPYYLDYNPYPHSVDKASLADIRLPNTTSEQRAKLGEKLQRAGRAVGITFAWGGKIGPDTRDAHRLAWFVQQQQQQQRGSMEVLAAVLDGIMEAYNVREQDVSDRKVLVEIAGRAGLDRDEVEAWLQTEEGFEAVDRAAERSKAMANAGVPIFIVQQQHRLDSTPDPMELMELFVRVKEPSI